MKCFREMTVFSFREYLVESEKRSSFSILKKSKEALSDSERKEAIDAGCVWHFSHLTSPTCAIWKGTDSSGNKWFCSNTHRCYGKDKTLKSAIKSFHNIVKPSA